MKLSRRGFLGGCLCCVAAPGFQAAAADSPRPDFVFEEIGDGVWRHTSWSRLADGNWFPSNGMVAIGRKRVLMVDTAWTTDQTALLMQKLGPLAKGRAIDLFITHFHADRMGGISTTAARGIVSHAFTRTVEEAAINVSGHIDKALPGETQSFDLGGRVVEAFYPGPAHTVDNAVVYDRATQTLFGGCMMRASSTRDLGNVADADISQWAKSVARVAARFGDVERVIPGHGAIGDAAIFAHTIKLATA